jgi:hypothetical protein
MRERIKVTWIALASFAVFAHMVAPWTVRAQSPAASVLYAGSGLLLATSFLVMCAVPLWEMWGELESGP